MPVFVFLAIAPAIFYLLGRIEIKKFPAGLMAAVLLLLLTVNAHTTVNFNMNRYNLESHNLKNIEEMKDEYGGWIKAQGQKDDRFAAINPWSIYLQSRIPCGLIPHNIDTSNLEEFQQKFGYNYFIVNEKSMNGSKLNDLLGSNKFEWLTELIPGLWRVQKL
jgi:hypothetical protein